MKRSELIQRLNDLGIDANTISFYVDENGNEESDTQFTECEISGSKGDCAGCTALDSDGNVVHMYIGEWLISGHLGRLAGAF